MICTLYSSLRNVHPDTEWADYREELCRFADLWVAKTTELDASPTCIWVRAQRRRHRNTSLCRYPKKSFVLLSFLATPQCFYKYTTAPTWDGPTVLHEPRHAVSMVTTYSRRNGMCGGICVRVFMDYYGLNVISRYDEVFFCFVFFSGSLVLTENWQHLGLRVKSDSTRLAREVKSWDFVVRNYVWELT